MSVVSNLIQFALILMFLVLVHEAGHMYVARWTGMRVERFSIFFGKPVASFTKGETEYAIGWLPLGGYVKISGMTRDEDVPDEHLHRTYSRSATWKKIATIAAGPGINIVVAILAFAALFWIGVPGGDPTTQVEYVQKASPAASIGLRPGDTITAVNGIAVSTGQDLRRVIEARPKQDVRVTYTRDGVSAPITRRTTLNSETVDGREVGRLGFGFHYDTVRFGPVAGVRESLDYTWYIVTESGKQLGRVFVSQRAREDLQSVVGVGAVYNEIANEGLLVIIQFIGVLSLALAVFNLIPLPPLDGGHILFAVIEHVRGRPLPRAVFERASIIGLALLLMVMVFTLQNDIIDIRNGTVLGPR